MSHPVVPPIGSKVLVEATVVFLNYWPSNEGPALPVPCVKVREGILFGVACADLRCVAQPEGVKP